MIRSFRKILDDKLDGVPQEAFFMKGAIEEFYEHNEWKIADTGQGFGEIVYGRAKFYIDTAE